MNYVFVDELKHENSWLQQVTTIISWILNLFFIFHISVEGQKGINAVQIHSIENQKGSSTEQSLWG